MEWTCVLILFLSLHLHITSCTEAAFNVSLELQGDCSDQLTLICRHSDILSDPNWIHNGTAEGGQLLSFAFPGAMYTVQSNTEHRVTISGVGNVTALDGYIIQCVYSIQSNFIKSNTVKYSFIPPDYRPALSLVNLTSNFSERLSTFIYSYQESCSLYPRCTPYFSVEHTVSPQLAVSNSSSGCSVEYTIHNLMRCVSYQSTATANLSNQRGDTVVVVDTVMLSPGLFTITSVYIGANRDLISVTYMENESDCPGYPTEWYTVDVDGVQVADLTADAVQSLAINHTNGSVTLFLPLLNQPLPENATTLNMTKYNTVPTNRSDYMGNIVTEMVTWGTSAVFALRESPPGGEPSAAVNNDVAIAVIVCCVGIIAVITVVVIIIFCTMRNKKKEAPCIRCLQPCIWCLQPCIWCLQPCIWCLQLPLLPVNKRKKKVRESSVNPQELGVYSQEEELGYATTRVHDVTPSGDPELVKGTGRQLPMPVEEEQKGGVGKLKEVEASRCARHAAQRQHYAELQFADERPIPAPPSDMFVVVYAQVSQA